MTLRALSPNRPNRFSAYSGPLGCQIRWRSQKGGKTDPGSEGAGPRWSPERSSKIVDGIKTLAMVMGLSALIGGPIDEVRSQAPNPPPEKIIEEAKQADSTGDFQKVLRLLDPLLRDGSPPLAARRLQIKALAGTGKSSESLEAYERLTKETGKEHEGLLRDLALVSILPLRGDMREQVRGAAYSALKEVGTEDVIPYLEDGLADRTGMLRALVVEGLGKFKAGRDSKRFQQALKDPAGWVRVTALKALGESREARAIPLVEPLLSDDQAVVRAAAAGALVMLGKTSLWPRLERAATSRDGIERRVAYRFLGALGTRRGLPLLIAGLKDSQPDIRIAAAVALGKLGLKEAVPALLEAFQHGLPSLRAEAAVSLGKLKAKEARPRLEKALRETDIGVQTASVDALLTLGTPYRVVAPTIQALVRHSNPRVRSGIAKALAKGHERDVLPILSVLLQDPMPRPRISAARSLGRIGGRKVISLLKEALRDRDEAVRATAAGALAHILSSPQIA